MKTPNKYIIGYNILISMALFYYVMTMYLFWISNPTWQYALGNVFIGTVYLMNVVHILRKSVSRIHALIFLVLNTTAFLMIVGFLSFRYYHYQTFTAAGINLIEFMQVWMNLVLSVINSIYFMKAQKSLA